MKKINFSVWMVAIAALLAFGAGCGTDSATTATVEEKIKVETQAEASGTEPKKPVGLANPASTKCFEEGLQMKKIMKAEGEMAVCMFADGTECEEWAYFRGECKQGDCTDWETCAAKNPSTDTDTASTTE
jgi:putative hemolysin